MKRNQTMLTTPHVIKHVGRKFYNNSRKNSILAEERTHESDSANDNPTELEPNKWKFGYQINRRNGNTIKFAK